MRMLLYSLTVIGGFAGVVITIELVGGDNPPLKLVIPVVLVGNIAAYFAYNVIVGSRRIILTRVGFYLLGGPAIGVLLTPILVLEKLIEFEDTESLVTYMMGASIMFHVLFSFFRRYRYFDAWSDVIRRNDHDRRLAEYEVSRNRTWLRETKDE